MTDPRDHARHELLSKLERAAEVFRAAHPAFPPLQSDVILDGWAPERGRPPPALAPPTDNATSGGGSSRSAPACRSSHASNTGGTGDFPTHQ